MKKETIGEYYPIDNLIPHPNNPRKNEEAVDKIARSIERFGFSSPIIAREEDRVIIAGHTRWKASKKLNLSKVPVIFMNLNAVDAELLMIADNKLGEKADWNDEKLAELLKGLESEELDLIGFDDDSELADLLDRFVNEDFGEGEGTFDIDDEIEPISKLGEIYKLGDHKLLCGDSTLKENWDLLMGDEVADMCFTDPPYGVSYVGKTADAMTIKNDELTGDELYEFLQSVFVNIVDKLKDGGVCYTASPAGDLQHQFSKMLQEHNLNRHKLVWVKHTFAMGRCDYHYQHEDIFYGWKEGAAHYFVKDRTQSTTLFYDKPSRSSIHPTMKPVELVEKLIKNSSRKKEIVIDAFGGSGTTMISSANIGRISRLIEFDPKYCDAIRKRWAQYAKDNKLEIGDGLENG